MTGCYSQLKVTTKGSEANMAAGVSKKRGVGNSKHCGCMLLYNHRCVCTLNGGMKFVPLIRAEGCVTAQSFQRLATDPPAFCCCQAV